MCNNKNENAFPFVPVFIGENPEVHYGMTKLELAAVHICSGLASDTQCVMDAEGTIGFDRQTPSSLARLSARVAVALFEELEKMKNEKQPSLELQLKQAQYQNICKHDWLVEVSTKRRLCNNCGREERVDPNGVYVEVTCEHDWAFEDDGKEKIKHCLNCGIQAKY